MRSKASRLDRLISKSQNIPMKDVKPLLANGAVIVNGYAARDAAQVVGEFDSVAVNGVVLQNKTPVYLMLNKPRGVVSATRDSQHTTVLDLIAHPQKAELHIVGRLDLNSTGLVLLTNDGRWSRQLMSPLAKVEKHYQVEVQNPLTTDYVSAFAAGMHFDYENVAIKPVQLTITSTTAAYLVLTEGRYHQIKRMFGRFRNTVLSLHRSQIGPYVLDDALAEGEYRAIKPVPNTAGN